MSISNEPGTHPDVISSVQFASTVRDVQATLLRYAKRLTNGNTVLSEDLVQEALMRAWARRDTFLVGTNIKAWLFRIVRNCFLSLKRRDWRFADWSPDLYDDRAIVFPDQEEALHVRDLRLAIGTLSANQRQAFSLIRDGMSYQDVATLLDVQEGTIKSRVHRARAVLIAYFEINSLSLEDLDIRRRPCVGHHRVTAARPPAKSGRYVAWKATGSGVIGARLEQAHNHE